VARPTRESRPSITRGRRNVPYRIDIHAAGDDAIDRLIDLGALDVDVAATGAIAALLPDGVAPDAVARALGLDTVAISDAVGRDENSVWVLRPPRVQIGRIRIVPAGDDAEPGTLRLIDASAFGTGLHPTTALCVEALDDAIRIAEPKSVLDVGTGSGILALAALTLGVPHALGIDVDDEALRAAGENARLNDLERRLQLARGGPDCVADTWPLAVANVLAAPLIEMAPALVRRLAHRGQLILSGIPESLEGDVARAYRHLGMRRMRVASRGGWVAIIMQASW
jgi:ribosomal protein L11 methyltransferase